MLLNKQFARSGAAFKRSPVFATIGSLSFGGIFANWIGYLFTGRDLMEWIFGPEWLVDFMKSPWPWVLSVAVGVGCFWFIGYRAVKEEQNQAEKTREAFIRETDAQRKALDLPIRLSASAAFALELSAYRSFIDRSRVEIERAIAVERSFWSSAQTWLNHSAPPRLDPAFWRRESFNYFEIPAPPTMAIVQPNTDTKKVGMLTTLQFDYDPQANGPLLTAMNANIKAVENWVSELETAYKKAFQKWAAERDQLNKRLAAYE